jgi:hypothetical protein
MTYDRRASTVTPRSRGAIEDGLMKASELDAAAAAKNGSLAGADPEALGRQLGEEHGLTGQLLDHYSQRFAFHVNTKHKARLASRPADMWRRNFRFDVVDDDGDNIPGGGKLADALHAAEKYDVTVILIDPNSDRDGDWVAKVFPDGEVVWK